jgi:hypothetical protein
MNIADLDGATTRKRRSALAIAFYTQCRLWHGYLSAFAFLTLIFFSATGVLLNHPDWLVGDGGETRLLRGTIAADRIHAAQKQTDAAAALARLAAQSLPLLGAYSSGDVEGGEAILRFEGVKGTTDVTMDLRSGATQARLKSADPVTMLDDLHRGKNAGSAWRGFIDISGIVILVLSLLGYILFFAMRYRLRTALILTVLSIAGLAALFFFFVP